MEKVKEKLKNHFQSGLNFLNNNNSKISFGSPEQTITDDLTTLTKYLQKTIRYVKNQISDLNLL